MITMAIYYSQHLIGQVDLNMGMVNILMFPIMEMYISLETFIITHTFGII